MKAGTLCHILYNKRHYVIIYLGNKSGKTLALLAEKMPNQEVAKLRMNLEIFKTDALPWIKKYLPISYTHAIRTFNSQGISVLKTYEIKSP